MKNFKLMVCLLGVALFSSGCASLYPLGSLYTEVKVPMDAASGGDVAHTKVGVAKAESFLSLIATGDASLNAAIQNGNITKVKYVDYDVKNFLGIYGQYTTTVYGD